MKKTGLIAVVLIAFLSIPSFSMQKGLTLGGGVDIFIPGAMPYETIGFQITNDNGFGAEFDLKILENFVGSKNIYFEPNINLITNNFYFGIGYLFIPGINPFTSPFITGRTGYIFNGFNVGSGTGKINLGAEYSPTFIYIDDAENEGGGIIASALLSILSSFKIEVGFTWKYDF